MVIAITVGDRDPESIGGKIAPGTRTISFDVFNEQQLDEEVQQADLVISMLPAMFHPLVARACLQHRKNMLTASYVSPEMNEMDAEAKSHRHCYS